MFSIKGVAIEVKFDKDEPWFSGVCRTQNNGLRVTNAVITIGLRDVPSWQHSFFVFLHELGHLTEQLTADSKFLARMNTETLLRKILGMTPQRLEFLVEREARAWVFAIKLAKKVGISNDVILETMKFCLYPAVKSLGKQFYSLFDRLFSKSWKEVKV